MANKVDQNQFGWPCKLSNMLKCLLVQMQRIQLLILQRGLLTAADAQRSSQQLTSFLSLLLPNIAVKSLERRNQAESSLILGRMFGNKALSSTRYAHA